MKPIIKVQNLSKKYQITHQSGIVYNTLRDDLIDVFTKPAQFLLGRVGSKEYIWALKNVNFEVEPGEILGIIGPNGAGKSTLLKILTRITPPTEGQVIIRGRIGSLLEVGTGFHPELTGRENIYLNSAILGMKKKEIDRKFNEIVEFSGVGKFLDTPLKRYSSGMNVRLAFSVAANLDPEILLIDEVLAVGDAAFQKKSFGKMEEVTQSGNRTILFVSHNMQAIQKLCKRSILLERGEIKAAGPTEEVINKYLKSGFASTAVKGIINKNKEINIREISVVDDNNEAKSQIELGKSFKIRINYDVNQEVQNSIIIVQVISNSDDKSIIFSADVDGDKGLLSKREKGRYEAIVEFKDLFLNIDSYRVRVMATIPGSIFYDILNSSLQIIGGKEKFTNINPNFNYGGIINKTKWIISRS